MAAPQTNQATNKKPTQLYVFTGTYCTHGHNTAQMVCNILDMKKQNTHAHTHTHSRRHTHKAGTQLQHANHTQKRTHARAPVLTAVSSREETAANAGSRLFPQLPSPSPPAPDPAVPLPPPTELNRWKAFSAHRAAARASSAAATAEGGPARADCADERRASSAVTSPSRMAAEVFQ